MVATSNYILGRRHSMAMITERILDYNCRAALKLGESKRGAVDDSYYLGVWVGGKGGNKVARAIIIEPSHMLVWAVYYPAVRFLQTGDIKLKSPTNEREDPEKCFLGFILAFWQSSSTVKGGLFLSNCRYALVRFPDPLV